LYICGKLSIKICIVGKDFNIIGTFVSDTSITLISLSSGLSRDSIIFIYSTANSSFYANGNMIKDLIKEIVTLSYNSLNLPDTLQLKDGL
jgi:hypothetical protein